MYVNILCTFISEKDGASGSGQGGNISCLINVFNLDFLFQYIVLSLSLSTGVQEKLGLLLTHCFHAFRLKILVLITLLENEKS